MSEFTIIGRILITYHKIHSVQVNEYLEPGQRSKMECLGKIVITFNYFCEKLHPKYLREFQVCFGFSTCQSSEYL